MSSKCNLYRNIFFDSLSKHSFIYIPEWKKSFLNPIIRKIQNNQQMENFDPSTVTSLCMGELSSFMTAKDEEDCWHLHLHNTEASVPTPIFGLGGFLFRNLLPPQNEKKKKLILCRYCTKWDSQKKRSKKFDFAPPQTYQYTMKKSFF